MATGSYLISPQPYTPHSQHVTKSCHRQWDRPERPPRSSSRSPNMEYSTPDHGSLAVVETPLDPSLSPPRSFHSTVLQFDVSPRSDSLNQMSNKVTPFTGPPALVVPAEPPRAPEYSPHDSPPMSPTIPPPKPFNESPQKCLSATTSPVPERRQKSWFSSPILRKRAASAQSSPNNTLSPLATISEHGHAATVGGASSTGRIGSGGKEASLSLQSSGSLGAACMYNPYIISSPFNPYTELSHVLLLLTTHTPPTSKTSSRRGSLINGSLDFWSNLPLGLTAKRGDDPTAAGTASTGGLSRSGGNETGAGGASTWSLRKGTESLVGKISRRRRRLSKGTFDARPEGDETDGLIENTSMSAEAAQVSPTEDQQGVQRIDREGLGGNDHHGPATTSSTQYLSPHPAPHPRTHSAPSSPTQPRIHTRTHTAQDSYPDDTINSETSPNASTDQTADSNAQGGYELAPLRWRKTSLREGRQPGEWVEVLDGDKAVGNSEMNGDGNEKGQMEASSKKQQRFSTLLFTPMETPQTPPQQQSSQIATSSTPSSQPTLTANPSTKTVESKSITSEMQQYLGAPSTELAAAYSALVAAHDAQPHHPLYMFLLGLFMRHGWGTEVTDKGEREAYVLMVKALQECVKEIAGECGAVGEAPTEETSDEGSQLQIPEDSSPAALESTKQDSMDVHPLPALSQSAAEHLSLASTLLYELSQALRFAWGTQKSIPLSSRLLHISAELGDKDAARDLGHFYNEGFRGLKIQRHRKRAARFLRMAEERGPNTSWIFKKKFDE